MPPSGRGTAIIALFSMYSCSWWPTRYVPSITSSASREAGARCRPSTAGSGRTPASPRADRRPAGSGSVRSVMRFLASRSVSRSGAASSATGSAWWRITSSARIGWSSLIRLTTLSPGRSFAVSTTTLRPVEGRIEIDAEQTRVGHGRADRVPVPGTGEDQVVGVQGCARSAWPVPRDAADSARAAPIPELPRRWGANGRGRSLRARCDARRPGRHGHLAADGNARFVPEFDGPAGANVAAPTHERREGSGAWTGFCDPAVPAHRRRDRRLWARPSPS